MTFVIRKYECESQLCLSKQHIEGTHSLRAQTCKIIIIRISIILDHHGIYWDILLLTSHKLCTLCERGSILSTNTEKVREKRKEKLKA